MSDGKPTVGGITTGLDAVAVLLPFFATIGAGLATASAVAAGYAFLTSIFASMMLLGVSAIIGELRVIASGASKT